MIPCRFLLLCFIIGFTGCLIERSTYYVSPLNGNSTSYYAKPLLKDSVSTATYASGSVYFGSANTLMTDKVWNLQGAVYQVKQFDMFQAYYGVNAFFGSYKVASFDTTRFNTSNNWKALNQLAGTKSYAGAGISGVSTLCGQRGMANGGL